jgi:UBA/TS-N domain
MDGRTHSYWGHFSAAGSLPTFDPGAMAQLEGMGFPIIRCQKALLATGNGSNAEIAMEWLFAHMEDPGTRALNFIGVGLLMQLRATAAVECRYR